MARESKSVSELGSTEADAGCFVVFLVCLVFVVVLWVDVVGYSIVANASCRPVNCNKPHPRKSESGSLQPSFLVINPATHSRITARSGKKPNQQRWKQRRPHRHRHGVGLNSESRQATWG